MKEVWLESATEDLIKAKKKFEIGDYKGACIYARISASKSVFSKLSDLAGFSYKDDLKSLYEDLKSVSIDDEEIHEAVAFLSRFILYDDIMTPYVVEKWEGLPTHEDGEKALLFAEKLLQKFKTR
ncbi:MAG TPA: HEPN domain-containing protein [Candidatus Hydrothermia bacterium]|nr:HEPN domain-containing protein [Candidatus Hydrothermae bacterium]MDD3649734.1 HEPN domain-containing protein [Candidatus Hydrothermia bacterium]MDD5572655.1 HEPN domain-containing protein [Candidatus Hydrothermia bacterium]HOK23644.1 HEPN domain-containing protein [Candidatus Hydrothermia bacterium]HOL24375.1 HEPN domain-containing protein [Candidatus Hydrothermia bacterium]